MKPIVFSIAVFVVLAAALPARADQCEWIEPAVAERAARELTHRPEYLHFCEPCGEVAPGAPQVASRVEVAPVERGLVSVRVNGESVDLAYTFVKTSERQYRNLAALAGCPTTGVSPDLRVESATASGVLIQADGPPPPESTAPVIHVSATPVVQIASPPVMLWIAGLIVGITPVALLAALALWASLRRRTLHVPRAARLSPPE